MILILVQNQISTLSGRQYVFMQINQIDAVPDFRGSCNGFFFIELGKVRKVSVGLLEDAASEGQESRDIPLFDDFFIGVNVD